jgi:hypothetical protein
MTMIAAWPVVARDRIVHAFKPGGSSTAEGPFRTLRRHEWVSSGARVSRRTDRALSGQLTVFSSLNVDAARLARQGHESAAALVARKAATLEAGLEFTQLSRLLSELPGLEAEQVVKGVIPDDSSPQLTDALREVAVCTEQLRTGDIHLSSILELVFAGQIAEVTEGHVLLTRSDGAATMIPRWMADAVKRDRIGDLLALVADRLDGTSEVIEVVPAICIDYEPVFRPYGRRDPRNRTITAKDARQITGEPQPLRILVPVLIDG